MTAMPPVMTEVVLRQRCWSALNASSRTIGKNIDMSSSKAYCAPAAQLCALAPGVFLSGHHGEGWAVWSLIDLYEEHARGCIELAERLEEPNLRELLLKMARDCSEMPSLCGNQAT